MHVYTFSIFLKCVFVFLFLCICNVGHALFNRIKIKNYGNVQENNPVTQIKKNDS